MTMTALLRCNETVISTFLVRNPPWDLDPEDQGSAENQTGRSAAIYKFV